MVKSGRQVKRLASTSFSGGNAMESDVLSKFVRGVEGGSKRRRMAAGKFTEQFVSSSASIFSELTGLPLGEGTSTTLQGDSEKSSRTLPETNIGFKLLIKSGWKEGSGLGISEQGRLNPLEPQFKFDRRGIGAEKDRKHKPRGGAVREPSIEDDGKTSKKATKKEKNLSKKARKRKAEEEKMQEQAFEHQFRPWLFMALAQDDGKTSKKATKKEENLSKKARKRKAEEEKMQEQAFEQQFYREFWPEKRKKKKNCPFDKKAWSKMFVWSRGEEEKMQEQAFEQQFYREAWPEKRKKEKTCPFDKKAWSKMFVWSRD